MSVAESHTIDLVATRPHSSTVKLVIADHLDWDDLEWHLELLQAKLNSYISFVESGQLLEVKEPPIPRSPEVEIVLAAVFPPPNEAEPFLAQVRQFLAGRGLGFEVTVRDQTKPPL